MKHSIKINTDLSSLRFCKIIITKTIVMEHNRNLFWILCIKKRQNNKKKWLLDILFTCVHILLDVKLNDIPTIRIILSMMKKSLWKQKDAGARLTICCRPAAIPNIGWERVEKRERADRGNPWSEKGLLLQWSWVLAHISWLPGCPLTAIRRPYSFKTLIGHL